MALPRRAGAAVTAQHMALGGHTPAPHAEPARPPAALGTPEALQDHQKHSGQSTNVTSSQEEKNFLHQSAPI